MTNPTKERAMSEKPSVHDRIEKGHADTHVDILAEHDERLRAAEAFLTTMAKIWGGVTKILGGTSRYAKTGETLSIANYFIS